jgi:hypothetical protein
LINLAKISDNCEERIKMAAGTGVAGPGSSCSPSTDIPPENIKEEDESRRGEAGLADAWDKYRQFEAYR